MLGAVAAACNQATEKKPLQAVRVEAVASIASQSLVPYGGTALAQTQVDLAFQVGGYVQSIGTVAGARGRPRALQAGDRVTKGMALAMLRESDYRAKVAELNGMRSDAGFAYMRAKSDYERARTLIAQGSISQAEFDSVKARYGSAAGAAAAANARVGEASIALSDARLRAPFDGFILARNVEVGALVAPGAVALTIADTTTMRVIFGVPDSVQRTLAVDQTATVTTDAIPGRTFVGTISKIAAQADPKTRVFDVEATVDNADQALKVGMVMQVQIDLHDGSAPAAALIPLSAVVRPPKATTGFASFVVAHEWGGDVAHLRTVLLGDLVANRVAVTKGLGVGDRVVVQGATLLTDNQPVAVIP